MEIADIFVVNKADREGADRTVASIEGMLSLQSFGEGQWRPPIVKTEASAGKGIVELLDAIERFRRHTAPTERERRRRARRSGACETCWPIGSSGMCTSVCWRPGSSASMLDRIAQRETDPYSVVDDIVARATGARDDRMEMKRG